MITDDEVRIPSSLGNAEIRISNPARRPDSASRPTEFDFQIVAEDGPTNVNARTRVFVGIEVDALPLLFESIDTDWRGWVGEKGWAPMESINVVMLATHDGKGHVSIQVTLASSPVLVDSNVQPPPFARAALLIDVGAAGSIAAQLRSLLRG